MTKRRTSSLPGPSKLTAVAPGGLVPVGEVRAELGQVVPGRARGGCRRRRGHAEAARVAGVDQPLQPVRSAVGVVRARTGRRRRSPSRGRRENSATGISSIASTPRSTRWSRCSIAAVERALRA